MKRLLWFMLSEGFAALASAVLMLVWLFALPEQPKQGTTVAIVLYTGLVNGMFWGPKLDKVFTKWGIQLAEKLRAKHENS